MAPLPARRDPLPLGVSASSRDAPSLPLPDGGPRSSDAPMELNLDAAEIDDEPEALTALADRLNLACGAHAGDASLVRRALRRAAPRAIPLGAHPSYPDRAHFGRRPLDLPDDTLRASLMEQLLWLRDLVAAQGFSLAHVKPHGALYHAATRRPEVARVLIEATVAALGAVAVVVWPGGALHRLAASRGLPVLREGFADRGYTPAGELVPRGADGDVLTDEAEVRAQVRSLVRGGALDTLCVHGDGPHALSIARLVREELG